MEILNIVMHRVGPSFLFTPLAIAFIFIICCYEKTAEIELTKEEIRRAMRLKELQEFFVVGAVFIGTSFFSGILALVSLYGPTSSVCAHTAVLLMCIAISWAGFDEYDSLTDKGVEIFIMFLMCLGSMYVTLTFMFDPVEKVRAALQAVGG